MKDSFLHIKIESQIKGIINDAAQWRGVNLSEFVIKSALDDAMSIKEIRDKYGEKMHADKVKDRPRWARKSNGVTLTDRTLTCLLKEGFDSKIQVRTAFTNPKFDISIMPNFGNKCHREVLEWLGI
jgi:hypothetical protein